MKRISLFLLSAICSSAVCFAQDNPARAAAEREAAEEGYRRLNSAVEALTTGQADLQRRISALADEVRTVRAQDNRIDTSKFVTRDEFNRMVKAIDEIERKREDDKKLIREEFDQLKKDIVKLLNAPVPAPAVNKKKLTPEKSPDRPAEKSSDKPDKPSDAAKTQEGVPYTIEKNNTLTAIVTA